MTKYAQVKAQLQLILGDNIATKSGESRFKHFTDKCKKFRKYKFYNIKPTTELVSELQASLGDQFEVIHLLPIANASHHRNAYRNCLVVRELF